MMLGLLPEDLEHVECGTVRWKVAQEGVVFGHPAPSDVVVESVMNFRVIENDACWGRLGDRCNQVIKKADEGFSVDGASDLLVVQSLSREIKDADHRNELVVRRRDRMRLTNRRPRSLHRGRCRKSGFIKIEQLTPALASPLFDTGKFRLAGGKPYGVAVFFRLSRVRLKLNPLARSLTLSVSSEQGRGL